MMRSLTAYEVDLVSGGNLSDPYDFLGYGDPWNGGRQTHWGYGDTPYFWYVGDHGYVYHDGPGYGGPATDDNADVVAADFSVNDANAHDLQNLADSLHYLQNSPAAKALLLQAVAWGVTIHIIHSGPDHTDAGSHDVYWNPDNGSVLTNGRVQSAAMGLLHELAHTLGNINDQITPDSQYVSLEERRVIEEIETPVAEQLGEPTRTDHYGTDYDEHDNATYHT